MSVYIDRDQLEEFAMNCVGGVVNMKQIHEFPPADVERRKIGQWERFDDGIKYWWECSECHYDSFLFRADLTNYCPNCGAEMRGGEP